MRSSDWSSDVCSSDLYRRRRGISGSLLPMNANANWRPGKNWNPSAPSPTSLPNKPLRLGAVLDLVDNPDAAEISADTFARVATLARYYAGEALRLFEQGALSIEIQRAEKVLNWLHEKWGQPQVGLSQIYQLGPNSIRNPKLAREAMKILEDHHWVVPIPGGAKIDGNRHREVWEVIKR